MMDPCKEKEPRVIDNDLIARCIKEQGPKGEAGRLAQSEGVPFDEVEQIRFEFQNLLKIDHIWVLSSLTKLGLNNNLIEKIENLHALIHLKELDLSFNKIKKIENLDKLVKLEKLSFYDNLIEKIENMDTLRHLTILSIGKNFIEDQEDVLYLRRFKNLKSLNLAGNPCSKQDGFRLYIATFLPQLRYYEYKLIYPFEREEGVELYSKQLMNLEEAESKQREREEIEETLRRDAERNAVSFVERLNTSHLFDAMFENDEDGKLLLQMGEEVEEVHADYKEQFVEVCKQVFNVGQEQHAIRQAEIEQFKKCVDEAKEKNQQDSIRYMDDVFSSKKKRLFQRVYQLLDQLDESDITIQEYDEYVVDIQTQLEDGMVDTWRTLMRLELELFEQLEEVQQTFAHGMADLLGAFTEQAQGYFAQARALEVTYSEQVAECAQRYLTAANLEGFQVPSQLRQIMSDKEALANAVAASHDLHLQTIDNREDVLISRSKDWLEKMISELHENEIKRNRAKVLEICHFLDTQKEEFVEAAINAVHNINIEGSTSLMLD